MSALSLHVHLHTALKYPMDLEGVQERCRCLPQEVKWDERNKRSFGIGSLLFWFSNLNFALENTKAWLLAINYTHLLAFTIPKGYTITKKSELVLFGVMWSLGEKWKGHTIKYFSFSSQTGLWPRPIGCASNLSLIRAKYLCWEGKEEEEDADEEEQRQQKNRIQFCLHFPSPFPIGK